MKRTYLDWNATAPLRPEAREAMLAAMDAVGNPSSVHAEGRAAKAIVEKARGQVAALVGCEPGEVVFTSGATEAAAQVLSSRVPDVEDHDLSSGPLRFERIHAAKAEHDCVWKYANGAGHALPVTQDGLVDISAVEIEDGVEDTYAVFVVPSACGETGVKVGAVEWPAADGSAPAIFFSDATQAIGKLGFQFHRKLSLIPGGQSLDFAAASAHKLGGPKGVGALLIRLRMQVDAMLKGGGQEQGRRSGTENIVGIAGFGAAAEASRLDLETGAWDRISELRDRLEDHLATEAPDLIIFGKDAPRLPNTSCFAIPGWKGETQVMQMDLAGFAISAGSACSSGKVGPSRMLLAMGFDEETSASAIRVSMGPTTTETEVIAFADTWIEHYRRRKAQAA